MPNKFVVHCKRSKYDVYIGRPSKWGNPYVLEKEQDRQELLEKYKKHIINHPDLYREAQKQLKGKILGCWCAPRPCHGDVLSEIANGKES